MDFRFPLPRAEYVKMSRQRFLRIAVNKILNILARFMIIPFFRNLLYRMMGIRIGKRVFIGLDCYLDDQFPELITIGDDTTISIRVAIVAHDDSGEKHVDLVAIGKNVYVGVGAIILSGVTVGDGAIVGAGAVVTKNVLPGTTVAGSPARIIKESAND